MENVMTYGMESKLRLPSTYVEVTDNEMEYLDGGSSWDMAKKIITVICIGGAVLAGLGAIGWGLGAMIKVTWLITTGQIAFVAGGMINLATGTFLGLS